VLAIVSPTTFAVLPNTTPAWYSGMTWSSPGGDLFFANRAGVRMMQLQAFAAGLWDNGRVALYRAVMPAFGDCNTLGAMCMFAGRIAETQIERDSVKLKVNALTEVFDLQIPPNVIEASNVQSKYSTGQPPMGCETPPSFTVVAGSTAQVVVASGPDFEADTFDFGYILFDSGTSLGLMARTVRWSDNSGGYARFHLYEPLPWTPETGATFTALVPYVRGNNPTGTQVLQVPSNSPYTITVGNVVSNVGVAYYGGSALVLVSGPPARGQYAVNVDSGTDTATYTFNSADAGKKMSITTVYLAAEGTFQGFPYVPAASQAT
jgi:hypothetical protein